MNSKDIQLTVARYSDRYKEHGFSPKSLGWGKEGREELRFEVLVDGFEGAGDILDVGCGFGDFYGYLSAKGWTGRYVGLDITEQLVQEGRKQYPGAELIVGSFDEFPAERDSFDYAVLSGVFNFKLVGEDNLDFIRRTVEKMFLAARRAVIFNFQNDWVDYQGELAFHASFADILSIVRNLSRRFVLRQDYMPFESTIYIYKEDRFNKNNVFSCVADQRPEMQVSDDS